jgi:hypothetical protein
MDKTVSSSGQSLRGLSPVARTTASDFEKMERAARRFADVQRDGERNARNLTRALQTEYARASADIKERVARGFLSPEEAEKLGREAGRAYNQGVLKTIERQGAAGGFSGGSGQALYVGLANQLKQVDQSALSAGRGGLRTFANQLAQVAATEIGVRSQLGSLASTVGFFSVGALTTLGVMAGLAGIALLISKIGEESRKQKQAVKDLFAEIDKAIAARRQREDPVGAATEKFQAINREIRAAEKALREASQDRLVTTGLGISQNLGPDLGGIAKARKLLDDLAARAKEVGLQLGESLDDSAEKQRQKDEEARRLAEERRQQVVSLGEAELAASVAVLRARGEFQAAEAVAFRGRLEAIEREAEAMDRLTKAERERLELARAQVLIIEETAKAVDRTTKELDKAAKRGAETGPLALQKFIASGDKTPIKLDASNRQQIDAMFAEVLEQANRAWERETRRYVESRQREIAVMEGARQATLGYLDVLTEVDDGILHLAGAGSNLVSALANLRLMQENYAEDSIEVANASRLAAVALADVVAAFGQVAFSGGGAASAIGRGLTSGVASGIATGIPLVGIVTGAAGVVGNLLGLSKKAEEEARRMREARKQWDLAFEELALVGSLGGSQLAQETRRLAKELEAAFDDLKKAFPGTRKSQEFRPEDLEDVSGATLEKIRRAAAQGDEYSKRVLELLERQRDAMAELARLREEELHYFGLELDARQAGLEGRDDEAAAIRLQIEQERELAQLRQQYADELPEAISRQLEYVQALEREALAKEQAKKAAEEALRQQTIGEDLHVRQLAAGGDTTGADALRFQLEQERELREAVAGGISDSNLALLKQVQALEAVSRAAAEAAAAEAKHADELRRAQDLDARFLEAMGQQGAADDLRFKLAQDRERAEAQQAGLSSEFLTRLDEVLKAEAAARTQQADAAVTEAGRGAASLSVKDITGLSEVTGVRLDSRLFTTNTLLRQIELNTRGANRGVVVYQPRQSEAPTPDTRRLANQVDRIGANDLSLINNATGVRPSA